MSYAGQAYAIPCSRGGVNYSPNFDAVPAESMVDPSKNINMHTGGRSKRGGTAHVNGSAVAGTPSILDGFDFRLKNGTQFIVFRASDGGLYKNFTDTIKTGLATSGFGSFENFNNELYVTDGEHTPQTWNGAAASTSDITTPATDWSGATQPRYVIRHGRGASQRLWFFGVPGKEDYLYFSSHNDGKVVNGGTSGFLRIDTGDGFGIVGAVDYGERLIAFGKNQAYIVDDSDATIANWGYQATLWKGGAAHHKLIVRTPNDVIAMAEDGEIYSVTSVPDYGDYKQASISRPSFIHNWIADNANLGEIGKFHAAYDPVIRAIKFWVVRNGKTTPDTALVFFIDRPVDEAWMVHDNLSYRSGYDALCSFLVRKSTGVYRLYTGDDQGFMWELETAAKNDNSNGYQAKFRTPPLAFDNPRIRKRFRRGWIIFHTRGDYNVNVSWWVDNVQQSTISVSTVGGGSVYGGGVYGSAVYSGQEIDDEGFTLGNIGKRIQLELENSVADQDFFISKILIDHEPLGARVA